MFFGRNDAKAETPIIWPPHLKSWLIGKNSDAGRHWRQEEKGTTEDEMAGWHHRLDGCEFEWTPRVGDGQGGLACCDSWGRKESDMTERLNWTELNGVNRKRGISKNCDSVSHLEVLFFWKFFTGGCTHNIERSYVPITQFLQVVKVFVKFSTVPQAGSWYSVFV